MRISLVLFPFPSMSSSLFANIVGYTALVLSFLPMLPQIYKNFISKSTRGVSILMFAFLLCGVTLFAVYTIFEQLPLPVILQPHWLILMVLLVFFQKFYYS